MTQSFWIIWVWSTSNDKCSYKKHSGDLVDTRAGGNVTPEAEVSDVVATRELLEPQEAGSQGWGLS